MHSTDIEYLASVNHSVDVGYSHDGSFDVALAEPYVVSGIHWVEFFVLVLLWQRCIGSPNMLNPQGFCCPHGGRTVVIVGTSFDNENGGGRPPENVSLYLAQYSIASVRYLFIHRHLMSILTRSAAQSPLPHVG